MVKSIQIPFEGPMKKLLLLVLFVFCSTTYADSWIDTCRPGEAALKEAMEQIGNEEFDKKSCKNDLKTCLVYFKDTESLGTSVVHVVKLEALSGNVYEFEVNSKMSIFSKSERCKVNKIKLTKFF